MRTSTDRPFGVGFVSHFPAAGDLMRLALDEGVRIVAHSFADPTPFVDEAHRAGALVICQVRTVEDARQAAGAGVDIVTAQGTEAGGHTGMVSTLPLVPAIIDAVAPLPVIAAGGIGDGRGIAAALVLGAEAVWLGTRFLATPEAGIPAGYKEAVLTAGTGDTIFTEVFDLATGRPWPEGVRGRSVRNAFTDEWHGREEELRDPEHSATRGRGRVGRRSRSDAAVGRRGRGDRHRRRARGRSRAAARGRSRSRPPCARRRAAGYTTGLSCVSALRRDGRDRAIVSSFELPVTFVAEDVVAPAQQGQVVEVGGPAVGPVDDVVCVGPVGCPVTAREDAATGRVGRGHGVPRV